MFPFYTPWKQIFSGIFREFKIETSSRKKLHLLTSLTFKRQYHKMVKHTETIRRQIADELFECVWPFCRVAA